MISAGGKMENKLVCLKPVQSRSAFTVQVVIKDHFKTLIFKWSEQNCKYRKAEKKKKKNIKPSFTKLVVMCFL